jgi:hypothetical protein
MPLRCIPLTPPVGGELVEPLRLDFADPAAVRIPANAARRSEAARQQRSSGGAKMSDTIDTARHEHAHSPAGAPDGPNAHHAPMTHGSYGRFAAMLLTSTTVMLGLMYSMVYRFDHVRWSQTRFWMALFMGAAMTIIMLAFMLGMYANKRRNRMIFGGAALVFAGALYLARSQRTVGDVAWMKAMIPHHSIALTTSSNAQLSDPRVKRLSQQIIESQTREIAEMEALIADLERR